MEDKTKTEALADEFDQAVIDMIKPDDGPAQHLAQLYEDFANQVLSRATSDLVHLNQLAGMADVVVQKTERLVKIMASQVEELVRANKKPTPSPAAVAAKFAPVDRDGDFEQGDKPATRTMDYSLRDAEPDTGQHSLPAKASGQGQ